MVSVLLRRKKRGERKRKKKKRRKKKLPLTVPERPRPGEEEVPVAMERDRHHAVGQIKGLLDAVAVMDVDVDVEDPVLLLLLFSRKERRKK